MQKIRRLPPTAIDKSEGFDLCAIEKSCASLIAGHTSSSVEGGRRSVRAGSRVRQRDPGALMRQICASAEWENSICYRNEWEVACNENEVSGVNELSGF